MLTSRRRLVAFQLLFRTVQHEEECAYLPAHHEPSFHSAGARPCEGVSAIDICHGR